MPSEDDPPLRFHKQRWESSNATSDFAAARMDKKGRFATQRREKSPVQTCVLAEQLAAATGPSSAEAALHRQPRGRSKCAEEIVVPISRSDDALPPHMKSLLLLLNKNMERLDKFLSGISRWTSSEVHAANSKITALLTAQRAAIDDLALFCNQEACFANERINGLTAQLRSGEQGFLTQLIPLRFLYSIVNNITNMCNATEGLLFLYPTSSPESETAASTPAPGGMQASSLSPSPRRVGSALENFASAHQTGVAPATAKMSLPDGQLLLADSGAPLVLTAHVSCRPFTPLSDGSTYGDIYNICQVVARTRCAANFTAKATGLAMHFETLLACPVLLPVGANTCVGVLCLLNKVSPYGESTFTQRDERRAVGAAEQLGEVLLQTPLRVGHRAVLPLSPSGWQEELRHLSSTGSTGGTSGGGGKCPGGSPRAPSSPSAAAGTLHVETGVNPRQRDPLPVKFIFRSEYSGAALSKMSFKSRTAVEPGEVMDDVLGRFSVLEQNLEIANQRTAQALARVNDAEKRLVAAREETRRAVQDAEAMRLALERALRTAVFSAHRQTTSDACETPGNRSECSAAAPPLHDTESARRAAAHRGEERGARGAQQQVLAVAEKDGASRQDAAAVAADGRASERQFAVTPRVGSAFVRSALSLRHQSPFPSPPGSWNGRARPVGHKRFL